MKKHIFHYITIGILMPGGKEHLEMDIPKGAKIKTLSFGLVNEAIGEKR